MNQSNADLPWPQQRRHELDWLRVLAFGLLIPYHTGMLYVEGWGFHIKSAYQTPVLQSIMVWSSAWRMSLLFFVSGAALSFVIPRMTTLSFVKDRQVRLVLPLCFGILVIIAPQCYLQMVSAGELAGMGYLEFWRLYINPFDRSFVNNYDGIPGTHYTWNHLWFLLYIYAYSLLLFAINRLPNPNGRVNFAVVVKWALSGWRVIVVPILALTLMGFAFRDNEPWTSSFVNDWPNHARYFFVTLLGYFLVQQRALWQGIKNIRRYSLSLAFLAYLLILYQHLEANVLYQFIPHQLHELFPIFLKNFSAWIWIIAIVGYASHYLNFKSKRLSYLNHGIYTYYILHQTVIIIAAYLLSAYSLGPILEPVLVIALTVLFCGVGYEVFKINPVLRPLFGIRMDKNRRKSITNNVDSKPEVNSSASV